MQPKSCTQSAMLQLFQTGWLEASSLRLAWLVWLLRCTSWATCGVSQYIIYYNVIIKSRSRSGKWKAHRKWGVNLALQLLYDLRPVGLQPGGASRCSFLQPDETGTYSCHGLPDHNHIRRFVPVYGQIEVSYILCYFGCIDSGPFSGPKLACAHATWTCMRIICSCGSSGLTSGDFSVNFHSKHIATNKLSVQWIIRCKRKRASRTTSSGGQPVKSWQEVAVPNDRFQWLGVRMTHSWPICMHSHARSRHTDFHTRARGPRKSFDTGPIGRKLLELTLKAHIAVPRP